MQHTAAAARARSASSASVSGGGAAAAATTAAPPPSYTQAAAGGGGELQYRSESIQRCYEAQHHFVLTQLTAPGIDAFLDDDDDDDDELGVGTFSRSASKFV